MSKLSETLRRMKIYNTHDLLIRYGEKGKTDISVSYSPAHSVFPGRYQVYSPSHKTDPNGFWADYGRKSFSGNSKATLEKALVWATEKYGITEWAADPTGGGKVPKIVRDRAVLMAKQFEKN